MGEVECPLCSGPTTPCYLIDSSGSYAVSCHGMRKTAWGNSVHQSAVRTRVCVVCGYIALFAVTPGVFRPEAEETRSVAGLPIPVDVERAEAPGDEAG